jgi:hypothetical protein
MISKYPKHLARCLWLQPKSSQRSLRRCQLLEASRPLLLWHKLVNAYDKTAIVPGDRTTLLPHTNNAYGTMDACVFSSSGNRLHAYACMHAWDCDHLANPGKPFTSPLATNLYIIRNYKGICLCLKYMSNFQRTFTTVAPGRREAMKVVFLGEAGLVIR